jgi:HNH endonuclease
MEKCIYCKSEITNEDASVEHVFPAGFGCPDDWVLDCVCKQCNNRLGATIENWLANDSLEAVFRLRTIGSRSGQKVRAKRFRVSVPLKEKYGGFQGAIMEKDYETNGQFLMPPQAGFKDEGEKYIFFTKDDLKYPPNLEKAKLLSQKQIKVLAPESEHDGMMVFLKDKGITVTPDEKGKFHLSEEALEKDGNIVLEINAEIDVELQRAIAKIAFNYLAKIQGADYVLQERFDRIRSFINGGPYEQLVTPFHEPILLDDSETRRYLGHIFIFERNGNELTGMVSLFNQGMAYKVILSSDMGFLFYSLSSGHTYNPNTKRMSRLGSMPRRKV